MQSLIALDQALTVRFSQSVAANPFFLTLLTGTGVYLVYLVPFLLIYLWFAVSRKISLRATLAGVLAWEGLSKLVAKIFDRPRPGLSQIGAKELVFHRPDTSFPSDHSAFLMALAVSFYLAGERKLGHLFVGLAILVGVSRVGVGLHFPLDILGGWLVGALTAYLIYVIHRPVDRYIIEPLIKLARKFHL